ncbi:MAG TPA: hypothetical protein VGB44_10825, partial [Flavobacterium sp.]
MKKFYSLALFLAVTIFSYQDIQAQGSTLDEAEAFCAGGAGLTFQNGTGGTSAQAGIDYGCLGSEPNPAWFYLLIDEPGNLNFVISQTSDAGNPIDVDFIAWGPFATPNPTPAQINAAAEVGCSYSTAATESFSITGATTGSYYIVLITNFSGQSGTITLTQTGGNGGTDCDIVCPLSIDGGGVAACPVAILTAVYDAENPTYQWYDQNGIIAGATSADYNATAPGDYTVVVNGDNCVADASVTVTVPPAQAAPITQAPMDLTGSGSPLTFDLTVNDLAYLGLDPSIYSISYHETSADAQNVFAPIGSPEAYVGVDGQIIYISIQNFSDPCVTVLAVTLSIGTDAVQPPNLSACDQFGNFSDGVAMFDLAPQSAFVVGNNDADDFIITYHTSLANAQNDLSPIGPLYVNTGNPQTIFVRMEEADSPTAFSTTSFTLTGIPQPQIPDPADVTQCESYTLPALPSGSTYHSASGGAASTLIAPGTITNTGTTQLIQEIFIYVQSGTTPNCTAEGSFILTLDPMPQVPAPADVEACAVYELLPLPAGSTYHAGSATGPVIAAGTELTSSQTIVIVVESGLCSVSGDFLVTINPLPPTPEPADVTVCESYTLPALAPGSTYHSASGGAASTVIAPGPITNNGTDVLTQQIFIFSQSGTTPNCTSEGSFFLIIYPMPEIPDPLDVVECDFYDLPFLDPGSTYHQGTATGAVIPGGTTLTSSQTIVIVSETGTVPNCTSEGEFTVTISQTPIAPDPIDVSVCDSYTLPVLPAGSTYHDGTVSGPVLLAGQIITSSRTIVIDAVSPTNPNCTSSGDFILTITPTPVVDDPADVNVCDSYTLPALNVGNYFTGPGGTGTAYFAGDVITSSTSFYIYAASGSCSSESSFDINIFFSPVINTPTPLQVCDENNDGFSCAFDLASKTAEITGGAPGIVVTFHETDIDALNGVNAITGATYCNIVGGIQVIHVRAFNPAAPQCASFTTLTIQVNPVPVPNPVIADYRLCDMNNPGDGVEGF